MYTDGFDGHKSFNNKRDSRSYAHVLTKNAVTATMAKPNPEYNNMGTRMVTTRQRIANVKFVTSSKVGINANGAISHVKGLCAPDPSLNRKSVQKPDKTVCLDLENRFHVLGDELEGDLILKEMAVMAMSCNYTFKVKISAQN